MANTPNNNNNNLMSFSRGNSHLTDGSNGGISLNFAQREINIGDQ